MYPSQLNVCSQSSISYLGFMVMRLYESLLTEYNFVLVFLEVLLSFMCEKVT